MIICTLIDPLSEILFFVNLSKPKRNEKENIMGVFFGLVVGYHRRDRISIPFLNNMCFDGPLFQISFFSSASKQKAERKESLMGVYY